MAIPSTSALNTAIRQAELRGAPLEPLAAAIGAAGGEVALRVHQGALQLRCGTIDVGPLRDRAGVGRGMTAAGLAAVMWAPQAAAGVAQDLRGLTEARAPERAGVSLVPLASVPSAPRPSARALREGPSAPRPEPARRDPAVRERAAPAPADALGAAVHAAADGAAVLAMVADAAPAGPVTGGLRRLLMSKARWFNEELGRVDDAVMIWSMLARRAPGDEDARRVVATMMSVASQWADTSFERPVRDPAAAARVYAAVYDLHVSDDQDGRVLRAMMDVANRMTRVDAPAERFDPGGAVTMWQAVARLGGPDDAARAVRTAMWVAGQLTPPGGTWRAADACALWRGAAAMRPSDDRVLRTVMQIANERSRHAEHVGDAATLFVAAGQIGLLTSSEEALRVVRTLMIAANAFVDLDRPSAARVDAALVLWAAAGDVRGDATDHERALRTAWGLGNDAWERSERALAFSLWGAAWSLCPPDGGEAQRLVKSVLDIVGRSPDGAARGLEALAGIAAPAALRRPLHAGLLYYAARYDDAVAFADAHPDDPQLAALAADARRKQRRLDDAEARARAVVARCDPPSDLAQEDAAVSAACCLGFLALDRQRAGEASADEALDWFERARAAARRTPVPPRAWMGTSFVLDAVGDAAGAAAARARATEIDPDNDKAALDELAHEIAARAAAVVEVTVRLPAALVPAGLEGAALAEEVVRRWVRAGG